MISNMRFFGYVSLRKLTLFLAVVKHNEN